MTIIIFPTWKSWKIRYTIDDQKHRITYEIGHSDVDAVARLQKSIEGKIQIISCEELKSKN